MHQNIIGKNVRITKNVRAHIAEKMQNIKIHADKIIDANIICEYINNEYVVVGTVTFGKKVFHDKEKQNDLYVAIDTMFQKLERKIRQEKEKMVAKSKQAQVEKGLDATLESNNDENTYSINNVSIYSKPLEEFDALTIFNSDKKHYMAYFPIIRDDDLYSVKIGKNPVFIFKGNHDNTFEIFSHENEWHMEQVALTKDNNIDISNYRKYLIEEYNVSEAVHYLTVNTDAKFIVYESSVTGQIEGLYKESESSFVLIRIFDI